MCVCATYYEFFIAIVVLCLYVFILLLLRFAVAVAIDAQTYTTQKIYYSCSAFIIIYNVFFFFFRHNKETYGRPLNMLPLQLKNVLKDIFVFTRELISEHGYKEWYNARTHFFIYLFSFFIFIFIHSYLFIL